MASLHPQSASEPVLETRGLTINFGGHVAVNQVSCAFHAGTLNLAIKRANVGKYAGLGEAIDQVFMQAVGPDQKKVAENTRARLVAACGTLAWTFQVGRDE